jgi:hypothetical protein
MFIQRGAPLPLAEHNIYEGVDRQRSVLALLLCSTRCAGGGANRFAVRVEQPIEQPPA